MVKIKKLPFFKKLKKPKDAVEKMLEDYGFVPDFIPTTKKLFSKKSRIFYLKKMRKLPT